MALDFTGLDTDIALIVVHATTFLWKVVPSTSAFSYLSAYTGGNNKMCGLSKTLVFAHSFSKESATQFCSL